MNTIYRYMTGLIVWVLLSTSCVSLSHDVDSPSGAEDLLSIEAGLKEDPGRSFHPYSAVSALYRGLFLRFGLHHLSLDEKWRLIRTFYFYTPYAEEGSSFTRCSIDGFYESGDELQLIASWFREPDRLEWISDCIHSPLLQGPLLGRGAFIECQGQLYNYDDNLIMKGRSPVRLADLRSIKALKADGLPGARSSEMERLRLLKLCLHAAAFHELEQFEVDTSCPKTFFHQLLEAEYHLALGDYQAFEWVMAGLPRGEGIEQRQGRALLIELASLVRRFDEYQQGR